MVAPIVPSHLLQLYPVYHEATLHLAFKSDQLRLKKEINNNDR